MTKPKRPTQKQARSMLGDVLKDFDARLKRLEMVYAMVIDPTVVDAEVKKFLRGFGKGKR